MTKKLPESSCYDAQRVSTQGGNGKGHRACAPVSVANPYKALFLKS